VDHAFGATLDDVREQLNEGHKVIVGIDSSALTGAPVPGHHGDHAVQIVGIDDSDPAHPKVILNDPGNSEGRGEVIPVEKFFEVWGPSGNFMMFTQDGTADPSQGLAAHIPMLAGYYNSDGTYHWETDNTNRDPVSGTVVSWG
jgi:hypothetical protein